MELFISEAEIEDASMIIDYLNQVGGESNNLTYGLNECYLNEFEEMEVIQDFIDQENSLLLCGFIDDELVSLLSIQGEQKERLKAFCKFKGYEIKDYYEDAGISVKTGNERPEFIRLVEDIKSGKINTIVALKLDRISRSIFDRENIMKTLPLD